MSRSKAPLLLMEQLIMLLVFALAAALCVRAFVLADSRSLQNEARDQALVVTQSVATDYQAKGAQVAFSAFTAEEDGTLSQYYDANWAAVQAGEAYRYHLQLRDLSSNDLPLLEKYELCMMDAQGGRLLTLPVARQIPHGEAS